MTLGRMVVAVLDHSGGDCPWQILQLRLNRLNRIARDLQTGSQRVGGAQGDNPKCRFGMTYHALQHVMNRAITAAGKDRIVSSLNSFSCLCSSFRGATGWQDLGFDSRAAKLIGSGFDLMHALVPPEARERVVDEECLLHGRISPPRRTPKLTCVLASKLPSF